MKNIGRRLLIKYIRNYLGAVIIVFLLFIPMYYKVYSHTEKIVIGNAYSQLEKVTAEIDNKIMQIKAISDITREDDDINKIAKIKGEPKAEDSYVLRRATDVVKMNMLVGANNMGQYLIFKDNSVVISGKTALSSREYQNYSYYVMPGLEFEKWKESIFDGVENVKFYPAEEMTWEGNKKKNTIFCVTKEPGIVRGYDTAAVFLLDTQKLIQSMEIEESDKNFLYVIDSTGQRLYQSSDVGVLQEEVKEGQQEIWLNGTKYILLSKKADLSGFRLFYGITSDAIKNQIAGINQLLWLYLILAMSGIVMIAVWYAVNRAHHVKSLLKNFQEEDKVVKFKNEYDYVSTAVKKMRENNDSYKEQLKETELSVRKSMLERLLIKGVYSEQEKSKIEKYLQWDMQFYCVVCVKKEENQEDFTQTVYVMNKYLEGKLEYIPVSLGEDEQIYIIKMKEEENADIRAVEVVWSEVAECNYGLRIGISSIGTGVENLYLCYQQANWVIRWVCGEERLRVYRVDRDFPKKQSLVNFMEHQNLNNQLADLLLMGEEASVHKLFQKTRKNLEKISNCTEQEIMQLFFGMRMPIVRMWDDLGMEGEPAGYVENSSVLKMLDQLEDAACMVCERVIQEKSIREDNKKQKILDFVNEHFMEQELCVAYVADAFGISEKYFITSFKEIAGKNFSSYVEEKRLALAEEYILHTDENMTAIAQMVGYNTVDAFYKSFKKNYGIAPGKWKEGKITKN